VLLTTATGAAPNRPDALMTVDGAAADPAELAALQRLWVLFDGADADAMARARAQWKALVGAGVVAEYWAQDGGAWAMKARSGG